MWGFQVTSENRLSFGRSTGAQGRTGAKGKRPILSFTNSANARYCPVCVAHTTADKNWGGPSGKREGAQGPFTFIATQSLAVAKLGPAALGHTEEISSSCLMVYPPPMAQGGLLGLCGVSRSHTLRLRRGLSLPVGPHQYSLIRHLGRSIYDVGLEPGRK